MGRETFFFILKIIITVALVFMIFTVVIPKIKQIDKSFNEGIEDFINTLFKTSVTVGKKSHEGRANYSMYDFSSSTDSFSSKFLTISTKDDLALHIKIAESLLSIEPANIDIRSKLGFLYYMKGELEKAKENYELVLNEVPKRNRVFRRLKDDEDYRTIKRVLLESAALYFDMRDKDKMLDYYRQYLRVANRESVFREIVKSGIEERQARFGIFSEFSGQGLLSYEKAIKELLIYMGKYPDDKEVIYILGILNYEVVSLYFDQGLENPDNYIENADIYLTRALGDDINIYRKSVIVRNLEQLEKIKDKLLEKKNADLGATH